VVAGAGGAVAGGAGGTAELAGGAAELAGGAGAEEANEDAFALDGEDEATAVVFGGGR